MKDRSTVSPHQICKAMTVPLPTAQSHKQFLFNPDLEGRQWNSLQERRGMRCNRILYFLNNNISYCEDKSGFWKGRSRGNITK